MVLLADERIAIDQLFLYEQYSIRADRFGGVDRRWNPVQSGSSVVEAMSFEALGLCETVIQPVKRIVHL